MIKIDYMLDIHEISKSFTNNIVNSSGDDEDERFKIIEDFSLTIPRSKITALVGGNGAGKTTLFNIISGFLKPDKGKIILNNEHQQNLIGEKPHKIALYGVGRLFQDNHIFLDMSIIDNMLIADSNDYGELPFLSLFRQKKIRQTEAERIQKAKNIFSDIFGENNPFWDKKDDPAGSLSYGQQRLLSIARLFMGDYDLVLLDEPTAGINQELIKRISLIIKKMVDEKEITVFIIEHNIKFILQLADFCSFMSHGRITAFGTPEDVIGNDVVRKTYLGT